MNLKFIVSIFAAGIIAFGLTACGTDDDTVDAADIDVNKILTIVGEESLQRLEGTPLKAITMLADPLQDGSITVDFTYADPFLGLDISGMLSLYSNLNDSNFALITEVLIPFMGTLDLSVFLNEERIALQTNILDENFYGIRFSTFEQDFQTFAAAANLDPFIVEDVMMFLAEVEYMLMALEASAYAEQMDIEDYLEQLAPYFEPFVELFAEFFDNLELRRNNVTFGEQNIDAIRYSYFFTFEETVNLLEDLTDLLENLDVESLVRRTFYAFGEHIETQADTTVTDQMINEAVSEARQLQREMVRDARREVEDLRQEFEGYRVYPVILHVYLDNNGRLLRMFLEEENNIEIALDFGTSVYDPWYFKIITLEKWDQEPVNLRIDWEFESANNLMVNRINVDGGGTAGIGSATVVSEWNRATGDFIKWAEMGGWRLGSVEGSFVVQDGGFELRFSDIEVEGALLSLGITTSLGANIPEIDFINMDRWDAALIDRVEEAIYSLMMMAFMF